MITDETRLKRLKYRAWHRGFREADLILGPFTDKHAADLSAEDLDAFETLLDEADQDIYEWIVEKTPTPAEFQTPIMAKLKKFRFDAFEAREGHHGG
jgi:antitoxin CptB